MGRKVKQPNPEEEERRNRAKKIRREHGIKDKKALFGVSSRRKRR